MHSAARRSSLWTNGGWFRQFWFQANSKKNVGLRLGGSSFKFVQIWKLHWVNDWNWLTWVCREIWYPRSLWTSFMEACSLCLWNPPNQIEELSILMTGADEWWMIPTHLVRCGCFFNLKFLKAGDFSMKQMISFPGDIGVNDSQMFPGFNPTNQVEMKDTNH